MGTAERNGVYVSMMVDALKRKTRILTELLDLTKEQKSLLSMSELDQERFQKIIDEKGEYINDLNQIDDGFDALFRLVKKDIEANKDGYKEEIQEMQDLISGISDMGVEIQALEHQNSEKFKTYLANQRKGIRDFHVNNKTASAYYQNMANSHRPEQSYFFNETK